MFQLVGMLNSVWWMRYGVYRHQTGPMAFAVPRDNWPENWPIGDVEGFQQDLNGSASTRY